MLRSLQARTKCAQGFVLLIAVLVTQGMAATPPYPQSSLIAGMTWDFTSIGTLRKAHGSDLWPLTWASDGNLYGAWGDGGGFDGNDNNIGRVSLGFARIGGIPQAGAASSYVGRNVWGAAPEYAEYPATFGGKVDDLISIDGVLYGHGGLWTSANCDCPTPTLKSGDNPYQRTLTWSTDLGRSWQIAPWSTSRDPGSSLQYGQDYRGALDPSHVYFYYQRDIVNDPGHIYLRRVLTGQLTANPATVGVYEYAAAMDANGVPAWSVSEADAVPVFFDAGVPASTYANAAVVYDAGVGRYLLSVQHGNLAGQIGFFEAPAPWGPWRTVAYYEDWGGLDEIAGDGNGLSFPAKWISPDGATLWGVFSAVSNGFDSFNLINVALTINGEMPQISAPAAGTEFYPGERVAALGSGRDLSWSVAEVTGAELVIATGKGRSLSFEVPANATHGTMIRITLSNSRVSVYRTYAVNAPMSQEEVGEWRLNEGKGVIAADSSGEGNTGVLENRPRWVAGRTGEALDFEGREAVRVAASRSLANLYQHGLTVSAWIKPRSAGDAGRIVDKDGNAVGWFLKLIGDELEFVADQFNTAPVLRNSARPVKFDSWQHVAATWDGSTSGKAVHLYLDGVPADGEAADGDGRAGDDSAIPLTIGNRMVDLARGFDGAIQDVQVFARALAPSEIHELAVTTVAEPLP